MTARAQLEGILYAEFDNKLGPTIRHAVPVDDFVSTSEFDAISEHIVAKQPLCGSLVSMAADGRLFMGCPTIIHGDHYHRNALIFNLVFVFNTSPLSHLPSTSSSSSSRSFLPASSSSSSLPSSSQWITSKAKSTFAPPPVDDELLLSTGGGSSSSLVNSPVASSPTSPNWTPQQQLHHISVPNASPSTSPIIGSAPRVSSPLSPSPSPSATTSATSPLSSSTSLTHHSNGSSALSLSPSSSLSALSSDDPPSPSVLTSENNNPSSVSPSLTGLLAMNNVRADTEAYVPLILKMAAFLTALERESGFLSSAFRRSTQLPPLMKTIFNDLTTNAETSAALDSTQTVHFRLLSTAGRLPPLHLTQAFIGQSSKQEFPRSEALFSGPHSWAGPYAGPGPALETYPGVAGLYGSGWGAAALASHPSRAAVNAWDVPVVVQEPSSLNVDHWDLGIQRLFSFINGVNHVARLAALTNVPPGYVKTAISALIAADVVTVVDIFQWSNMYIPTNLSPIATSQQLKAAAASYIRSPDAEGPLHPAVNILRLYGGLESRISIAEYSQKASFANLGIDARRFVVFGVYHGLIRRLHEYPLVRNWPARSSPSDPPHSLRVEGLTTNLDGQSHLDALCVQHTLPRAEVLTLLGDKVILLQR